MKNFLKGFVFGSIGLAIIQNVVEILNNSGDYVSSKIAVKSLDLQKQATKKQKEIEEIASCDCENVNTQCIGFSIPEEPVYEDIEEDKAKRDWRKRR